MTDVNRRFVIFGGLATAIAAATGAKAQETQPEACQATPDVGQRQWNHSAQAKELAENIYDAIDGFLTEDGFDDAGYQSYVNDLLEGLTDNNLSDVQFAMRHASYDRFEDAHRLAEGGFYADTSVSRQELEEIAARIAEKDFPSDIYRQAAVNGVKSGGWSGLEVFMSAAIDQEDNYAQGAVNTVAACRVRYHSEPRPAR